MTSWESAAKYAKMKGLISSRRCIRVIIQLKSSSKKDKHLNSKKSKDMNDNTYTQTQMTNANKKVHSDK